VTSSYRGPELTPQQIIDLAQKIRNAPRTDQNEMRRFVFREALGAGDLDDELRDRYESNPDLDDFDEELPTPSTEGFVVELIMITIPFLTKFLSEDRV
jgi:hypothetical protein